MLGDFFKVQRGQVTGANAIWIARQGVPQVPRKYLFPTVTDAGEIIGLGGAPLRNADKLQQVIDLPADLATLPDAERKQIGAFLDWAKREGVTRSYVVTHRKPWWRVGLKPPPPIIMTYMGRRPPVFARNLANARLLNIAHGLYPLRPVSPRVMEALVAWLNANVSVAHGRTYGGGLVKFEPGEAMRIPVPPLEYFNHVA